MHSHYLVDSRKHQFLRKTNKERLSQEVRLTKQTPATDIEKINDDVIYLLDAKQERVQICHEEIAQIWAKRAAKNAMILSEAAQLKTIRLYDLCLSIVSFITTIFP